jgi:uncharacterized protein
VAAAVQGGRPPRVADAKSVLAERRGCFVTLTRRGELRGCIGIFQPYLPLGEQVVEMAAEAAQDPRFVYDPIRTSELPHLAVEVSVLSELAKIADPLAIELGVHGIYIVQGGRSGCFLPEVATDTGWSKEEFLSQCCAGKAGMGPLAWKDPKTTVYTFTSEKFGQEG